MNLSRRLGLKTHTAPSGHFHLFRSFLISDLLIFYMMGSAVFGQTLAPALPDAPLQSNTAEVRSLLEQFGPSFSAEVGSHFTIISDASNARVVRLGQLADSTYSAIEQFARSMKLPLTPARTKMIVLFFDRWDTYEQYAERTGFRTSQWVPGFFDQHTGRCIMFNYANATLIHQKREEIESARKEVGKDAAAELVADATKDAMLRDRLKAISEMEQRLNELENQINQTVFRHELAHQVLFHFGLQRHDMKRRRWLQEGLATQFEIPAGVNQYRLKDFLAIQWGDEAISLRRLVTDPDLLASGTEESSAAYAAAWALVYYLIEKHPTDFGWYMTSMANPNDAEFASGVDDLAIFERAFGKIDTAFERRWRAYVQRLAKDKP